MSETLKLVPEVSLSIESETMRLAENYLEISTAISDFYLNANLKISEDRQDFAKDVQLHIDSLVAILKRVKGPIHDDLYKGLSFPIGELTKLRLEWQADGVATTRDIVRVAELILDTILLAAASFDPMGTRHTSLRKRLVAALA